MNTLIDLKRSGVVLGLVIAIFVLAPAAQADLPPYEFNPELSLTSDCSTSATDPIPDPGCPYPPPPSGPTQSNCSPEGCSSRFEEPRAIAVDPYGNEYVATTGGVNGWIRVFDDEGFFITELSAPQSRSIAVDSEGNLYVFSLSKVFRFAPSPSYDPEAGDIEYDSPGVELLQAPASVGGVAVDSSNDHLFVTLPNSEGGEIREYGSANEGNPLLDTSEPEKLGTWTESIVVDAQRRRLYVSYCRGGVNDSEECGVLVLNADDPEEELKEITGSPSGDFDAPFGWLGIAIDEELGYLFVLDFFEDPGAVYQFGEDYEYLSTLTDSRFTAHVSLQIAVSNGELESTEPCDLRKDDLLPGDACNRHILFIPTLPGGQIGNRALAYEPPGEQPPVIEGVSVAGIGETQALLRAIIDPQGGATTYRFEITTQASFEAEGFEGAEVAGEGVIPGASLATQVGVPVDGLTPGETYRFRVVAENGIGVADEEGQNEATFATYSDAPISPLCVNREVRVGSSARLPDCRAYELVTPPDTNGRSPRGTGFAGLMFPTIHASPDGNAVSFKIEGGSLPGTSGVASFEGDPYVSARGPAGWTTALAGPTGEQATKGIPLSNSVDQGYRFWQAEGEGPAVIDGNDTQYIRYPDGRLELIGRGSLGTDPVASGRLITENGTHIVFGSSVQLEPNAPPVDTKAVYDITPDEVTHVVSLLPGDLTPAAGQNAIYRGASKDGEGIAFSIGSKLYLRVGNETTYEVAENVTFAGVSDGGERIFYVEGGNLKALDTSGATQEVIDFTTTGDVIPVNVSTDGSRAYFVSPSVLGGTNPEGDSAQVGKQNLYLSEEGSISFVATVTDRDVEGEPQPKPTDKPTDGLGVWLEVLSGQLAKAPSRLNPDGSVLLFQSRAEITGYEESEFAQIYRYDTDANRLHCISCIPTKTPATGGASLETYGFASDTPPPFSSFSFVPNLTPAGNRVFFESTEALVSTDTDEVQDVYEWEEQGVGDCARPGGCVYLISSGQSERDNFLYAHSQSGDDVFFITGDVLTGFDGGGTPSIYDARVNGGFKEDVEPPCVDEGCLLPLTPPPSFMPPAQSTPGDDNVQPGGKARACPKGKRKVKKNGKVRCVKKKKQKSKGGQAKQRAGAIRGAGK